MNEDNRESYENESLDESKLDRWYGNGLTNIPIGRAVVITISLIATMFIVYSLFN